VNSRAPSTPPKGCVGRSRAPAPGTDDPREGSSSVERGCALASGVHSRGSGGVSSEEGSTTTLVRARFLSMGVTPRRLPGRGGG
jgi:hypothetical protein